MKMNARIPILAALMAIVSTALATAPDKIQLSPGSHAIIQGNNRFAMDLYHKLAASEGNLFFSPYSISTALAMTYLGAQGQTEIQMAKTMHYPTHEKNMQKQLSDSNLPLDRNQFAAAFGKICEDLNARGKQGFYELAIANALWPQRGYSFLDDYLDLAQSNFDARLTELNFVMATEKARLTINKWVEKKTNNKIKDLIAKGVLGAMTRLVLTNAVYFKGDWDRQFKKADTKDGPFTLLDGEKVEVPMMNQTHDFKYAETDTIQCLELPYVENELSMVVILPRSEDGLPDIEKELTPENLSRWLSGLRKREVITSIPKFKMTSQSNLASVLKSMGMVDAFTNAADFSAMTGNRDLSISAVIHKAYVDVNEEGTEAAAATAVVMRLTAIIPTKQVVFRADHPFILLIKDNHTGSILFLGRVMNPKV